VRGGGFIVDAQWSVAAAGPVAGGIVGVVGGGDGSAGWGDVEGAVLVAEELLAVGFGPDQTPASTVM